MKCLGVDQIQLENFEKKMIQITILVQAISTFKPIDFKFCKIRNFGNTSKFGRKVDSSQTNVGLQRKVQKEGSKLQM